MTAVQASPWNPANVITMVRILMVPLFIWLLMGPGQSDDLWRWIALAIFVLAAATDGIDGGLARKHNYITNLGKILDPIADKFLLGAAFVVLSILGEIPWWITIVILGRELLVTIWRLLIMKRVVVPASSGGKIKTVLQIIAVSMFLFPSFVFHEFSIIKYFAWGVMSLAVLVTVVTGIQYLWQGYSLARASKPARKAS